MSQPNSQNPQQGQNLDQSPVSGQVGQGRDFTQFQNSSGNHIVNFIVHNPPQQPVPPVNKRDIQNRQNRHDILHRVDTEVDSRLEKAYRLRYSPHKIDLINPQKQKKSQLVNPPWGEQIKSGEWDKKLPPDEKIIDIFDQTPIAGKLLIVGSPGSGKTTTLLKLAKELIPRAKQDHDFPIPVLLSLTSWQDDQQTIAAWLVAELKEHGVRVDIGKQWLKERQLLPLLDGLDELKSERHELCIKAINKFIKDYQPQHFVVCSRLEEYENCLCKLDLYEAIEILPLTKEQIQEYLTQVGCSQFWQVLRVDPNLLKVAKIPLFLHIITWAYEQISLTEWQKLDSNQSRYRYLFDAYVATRFKVNISQQWYAKEKEPNPEQTRYWLKWLAEKLNQENKTEFLLEKMQPDWLESPTQKLHYIIVGSLITGLVAELKGGLIVGLIGTSLRQQLNIGFFSGLVWWIGIVFIESHKKIKLPKMPKTLKVSWYLQELKKTMIIGTGGGLIIGTGIKIGSYLLNIPTAGITIHLIYGAVLGLISGILGGGISILLTPEIDADNTKYPNQETCKSARKAIIAWTIMVAIIMLIEWLLTMMPKNIPPFALSPLLVGVGLSAGGLTCIQHFTLRIICWANGYSPWNYRRFLGYATERLFLQQVGGRYRFIHKQLQEHFVSLQLSPQTLKQSNILYFKKNAIALICIFFVIFTIMVPLITPGAMPISSNAMTPTISQKDKLFYEELERYKVDKRGEIIWFYATEDMRQKVPKYGLYFRRIVGLPKEQVEVKKGLVYINGKLLSEDYIDKPGTYEHKLVQVPADSYFYLGDNRNSNELDYLGGLVPQDHIKGQVIFRYWPPNRMGKIN